MNFGFDLDDTLIDVNRELKKEFKEKGIKWKLSTSWIFSDFSDIEKSIVYSFFKNKKGMCRAKPFFGAVSTIEYLLSRGHKVFIITARANELRISTIETYCKLFKVPIFVVGFGKSKLELLKKLKIDVWIDDCPNELLTIKANAIIPIMISNNQTLYNHYLRKEDIYYIPNVRKIKKIVK